MHFIDLQDKGCVGAEPRVPVALLQERKLHFSKSLSRWPSLDCQLKEPVSLENALLVPNAHACLL